ncbi:hypothetical protein C453_12776 [Haloferax elongans ATCC BAA-1513]|uniref:Uncharacterized protein n=1 Tax=Haloferax elongans ATCC BAA-1513 TaxID=1230453 RepID=M0HIP1_HALEO|nr:hypothetical protein [Haloferax elongans]ELZ84420.1 hypothetical protein C453_12776 [Haloferax elongans ATCC BAA-1513]
MAESTGEQKPTPPVPPTDQTTYPTEKGSRIVATERVDTCDCGGDLVDEEVATGRMVVGMWDATDFDADEYRLSIEWEQTEHRVRCTRCGTGYDY